ncbi:MAG: Na+ dependent nucleoside transporter N-terminal domain-containing protein, partial [Gemmatimonadota bacterium]
MNGLWQLQTAAERFAEVSSGLDTPMSGRLIGLLGMASMVLLAVLISYNRRAINWRLVVAGIGLQTVFGVIVLKTAMGRRFFSALGDIVTQLLGFQEQGA